MMGEKVAKRTPRATATWPRASACTPTRSRLKELMEQAGLARVEYFNMTAGVVALHRGYKL